VNDDSDAAAILARRQRFIALALSSVAGLAAGACRPQPCLSVAHPEGGSIGETPETPETPQTPETPETPETPQTPATPETPQTPEAAPR
jgi:hypothetical protein